MLNFVDTNFRGEGLELESQALSNFNANPPFLNNVTDPLLRAFAQIVHSYWTQLIRGTNSSTLCDGVTCESTLIPLNNTFVIPGGRFREQCMRFVYICSLFKHLLLSICRLLGQFLDNRRFDPIPAIRYCQRYLGEFHGRD